MAKKDKEKKDDTGKPEFPPVAKGPVSVFPLLRAGVVDSAGDMFTVESLRAAADAFQKAGKRLLVTKDFTGNLEDAQGEITRLEVHVVTETFAELRAEVEILAGVPQGQWVLDYRAARLAAIEAFRAEKVAYLEAAHAHADDHTKPCPPQLRPQIPPELELAAAMRASDTHYVNSEDGTRTINRFDIYGAAFTTNKVK